LGNVSANFKSVICVFTCVVHAKQLVQNAVNILAVNLFSFAHSSKNSSMKFYRYVEHTV
jgi:hypothetical protein